MLQTLVLAKFRKHQVKLSLIILPMILEKEKWEVHPGLLCLVNAQIDVVS